MPGDNECESCHRLFCEGCTPSHLEQEEQEIERRGRVSALKNRCAELLEKLEKAEETFLSFLFKLRGDIEKKMADAENKIACVKRHPNSDFPTFDLNAISAKTAAGRLCTQQVIHFKDVFVS